MAYNFGIPVSLIISITTISILTVTLREVISIKNFKRDNTFNKAWLTSSFVLLFSHMSDVTYYDGKISLLLVILISGLRCILKDLEEFKKHYS